MAKGDIVLLLRASPLNTGRDEEGLRVAVGLTICNPDVVVVLLDNAAWIAARLNPCAIGRQQMLRHWNTLGELGLRRIVERESLAAHGIAVEAVEPGVEIASRKEIADLLARAAAVLVY